MNFPITEATNQLLKDVVRKVVKRVAPPPKLTVSEWADQERRLSPEGSAEPGRWNTDRAPYQRGIMDAVNDQYTEEIVIMSSAQIGKTEIILNLVGYYISHDPSPMLVIFPQLELAESFSKDRLSPMVRDTPCLVSKIANGKKKKSGDTILHKKFPGGHVTLAGANSPSSLASRPVRFVLCDEVDRYPLSAGIEGDPVNLAKKRTKTFSYNRKVVLVSTPTIKKASRIESAYENSDKRKFYVPCPHCGHKQALTWSNIRFEKDDPETTYYECDNCPTPIYDHHKIEMLRAGGWIAEAPFKGVAGFHLSELYSPWSTFKEMVRDFLSVKDKPEELKTWVNTSLGESWEQKGEAPEWRRIYERRETYKINTIPHGGVFLTAGVDVQKDRIEVEIVAWGRNKESWSVDYRQIFVDTADEIAFKAKLDELLSEKWLHQNGTTLPIKVMAIDTGYRTQTVYSIVRKYFSKRVLAIKGKDTEPSIIGQPTKVDINIEGAKIPNGLLLWPVGVSKAKEELYGWLRQDKPTEEEFAILDGRYPYGFCHFPEYGEDFFKMLTAEQLVMRQGKRTTFEWVKVQERNEALDCRVYNRAAAAFLGIDRFQENHWAVLQSSAATEPAVVEALRQKVSSTNKRKKKRRESAVW